MGLADELAILERAFRPHPIDPAAAFAEWGGTYLDAARFSDGVRGKRWTELDAVFLEHHHDALVFLAPSAIGDYLPAYLAAVVRRDKALSAAPGFLFGVLTRGRDVERFDARFAKIAPDQRRAVARVLAAYEREVDGTARQGDVKAALDSYWRAEIGGAQ